MTSADLRPLFLALALAPLAGCGIPSSPAAPDPAPLAAGNINLIFVVSEDLNNNQSGDINPVTANLTSQGLQRSLMMGSYLQQQVLGNKNVTGSYALEPMTHPQTANRYPDLVALETVQQFALLNAVTLDQSTVGPTLYTASKYPPAEPEALWFEAPQRGLCRSAPCRWQPVSRAVGAVLVSPALQRWERETDDGNRSPVGTVLMLCANLTVCEKYETAQTGCDSRKCQTPTATPAKPGVLPV